MSEESLSSLAILHIYKHKDVEIDNVVSEFARLKGRLLAVCLATLYKVGFQLKLLSTIPNIDK